MNGKNREKVSNEGYSVVKYELTAQKNGTIHINMNVSSQSNGDSTYDNQNETSGFAAGESFTVMTYNNGHEGGRRDASDGTSCKIIVFRVLCAENLEYANKMLFSVEEPSQYGHRL